jgi:hypothetical protein
MSVRLVYEAALSGAMRGFVRRITAAARMPMRARQVLEILGEPAPAPEPPEYSFHGPGLDQHYKEPDVVGAFDDPERRACGIFDSGSSANFLIAAIDNRAPRDGKSRRASFRSARSDSPSCALAGVTATPPTQVPTRRITVSSARRFGDPLRSPVVRSSSL